MEGWHWMSFDLPSSPNYSMILSYMNADAQIQQLPLELLNFLTMPGVRIMTSLPLYLIVFWFKGGQKLLIWSLMSPLLSLDSKRQIYSLVRSTGVRQQQREGKQKRNTNWICILQDCCPGAFNIPYSRSPSGFFLAVERGLQCATPNFKWPRRTTGLPFWFTLPLILCS